jgi:hypothetical protein
MASMALSARLSAPPLAHDRKVYLARGQTRRHETQVACAGLVASARVP